MHLKSILLTLGLFHHSFSMCKFLSKPSQTESARLTKVSKTKIFFVLKWHVVKWQSARYTKVLETLMLINSNQVLITRCVHGTAELVMPTKSHKRQSSQNNFFLQWKCFCLFFLNQCTQWSQHVDRNQYSSPVLSWKSRTLCSEQWRTLLDMSSSLKQIWQSLQNVKLNHVNETWKILPPFMPQTFAVDT